MPPPRLVPGGPAQGRFENAVGRPTGQRPAQVRGGTDPSRPRAGGSEGGARGVDQISAPAAPAPPPAAGGWIFFGALVHRDGATTLTLLLDKPADRSNSPRAGQKLGAVRQKGHGPKRLQPHYRHSPTPRGHSLASSHLGEKKGKQSPWGCPTGSSNGQSTAHPSAKPQRLLGTQAAWEEPTVAASTSATSRLAPYLFDSGRPTTRQPQTGHGPALRDR